MATIHKFKYVEKIMKKDKVSSQSISFITTFIMLAALRSIVGYIAISIFAPLWNKMWKKKS
jgi:hypothetical protein